MNKKISDATSDEIKILFQDDEKNAISKIRTLRKRYFTELVIDDYTGEQVNIKPFSLTKAKSLNMELEYRLYFANLKRQQRLRNRFDRMIKTNRAIFLTLTFNDSFLSRDTSSETRRRYVARFLKEQCIEYVANIDFGQDERFTQREHYHALVIPKNEQISYSDYSQGFDKSRIKAEPVLVSNKSRDNIARYIDKLTKHALKYNGHYRRLIYSR